MNRNRFRQVAFLGAEKIAAATHRNREWISHSFVGRMRSRHRATFGRGTSMTSDCPDDVKFRTMGVSDGSEKAGGHSK